MALMNTTPHSTEVREIVRMAIYEGLGWFGTLPEPQGDVPERYHRWDDLGELSDRILAALKPEPAAPVGEDDEKGEDNPMLSDKAVARIDRLLEEAKEWGQSGRE